MTLLAVENLHVVFDTPHGESHTLRGIDFTVGGTHQALCYLYTDVTAETSTIKR